MPVLKEVKVLVRRSLADRGIFRTVVRCAMVGPLYTWHRIREFVARSVPRVSEFDRSFGVDTDGATNDTTYLRDLKISSPTWVHAHDYIPVKAEHFRRALSAVPVRHAEYTFIDFGCGKGRAMLLAAEHPFQKVVGIDFSRELVATARANWAAYRNPEQRCHQAEFVCADFLDYELPRSPAVLFFNHPCKENILVRVARRIRESVSRDPRPVFVLYVNPQYPHVWVNLGFELQHESQELGYQLYGIKAQSPSGPG
jgi:SAM-dependent methyltransferase